MRPMGCCEISTNPLIDLVPVRLAAVACVISEMQDEAEAEVIFFIEPRQVLRSSGSRVSDIKVLLPLPDLPDTPTNAWRGKDTEMSFKLLVQAWLKCSL